jgi:beta-lactamase regulating signal transducer with metallopeptidase domain
MMLAPYCGSGCPSQMAGSEAGRASFNQKRGAAMSSLVWLLIVWGVLTTILIVLLIYRSTLTMREDDQLFLDESESHMQLEQMDIMRKVNKLNPLVRGFGASSVVLILVIAGIWVYHGLTMVQ